jgi:multiple sugar transport system ATP-binding protein
MAVVTLERISKSYDRARKPAVDEVSLSVADGELMVLLGPSGCGKTTTLRIIAGLETISSGSLLIDGRLVNAVAAKDRDIAMVFQSYALYPHMSVRDNVAFGLRRRGVDRNQIDRRVKDVAATLGLSDLLDRRPHALSGGQRQRVALGRAIVRDPKVFLFDEPLSNLDAALRASTRQELANLHQRLASTMIYVTHDQVEAMTLGDRICVMHEGRVAQIGPPLEVYRNPANVFVARFLGSPPMNIVTTNVSVEHGRMMASLGGTMVEVRYAAGNMQAGPVLAGVRPEEIALTAPGDGPRAVLSSVERLGAETILSATLQGGDVVAIRAPRDLAARPGEAVGLAILPSAIHLFDSNSGAAIAAQS